MIHGTKGASFYIGTTAPVQFPARGETDAQALQEFKDGDYVEVQWLEDMGEFGAESAALERKFIDKEYAEKIKGSRDAGTMALVVGRDPMDAGQKAMLAAEADSSHLTYSFKVILNDKPSTNGTPTTYYFKGIVTSAKVNMGDEAKPTTVTFNIAISGKIIPELATLGGQP
jgi:hypothetical protein